MENEKIKKVERQLERINTDRIALLTLKKEGDPNAVYALDKLMKLEVQLLQQLAKLKRT